MLDGRPYTIVGIAAPDFAVPDERMDVWTPADYAATTGAEWITNPRGGGFNLIARLKKGVTLDGARAAADAIARTSEFRPVVQSLAAAVTERARPVLLLLFAAVGLLLAVACVNLANLQSVRNISRRRELATLAALGARPSDLLLRTCNESLVLGAGGAALGLLGARMLVGVIPALPGVALPRIAFLKVGLPAGIFAVAATSLTLLIVGVLALPSAGIRDPVRHLRGGSPAGRATTQLRRVLVAGELVACVLLVIGTLLLARTLDNLLHVKTGVAPDHVLTAVVDFGGNPRAAAADDRSIVTRILERLQSDPRVIAASVSTSLPPSVTRARIGFSAPGRDGAPADYMADLVPSSPDVFRTLEVPILQGRTFSQRDSANAPLVAIISKSTAVRLFGSGDPLGRTLPVGPRHRPAVIVGVVGDVNYHGLTKVPAMTVYVPFAQRPFPFRVLNVLVRTTGDPGAFAPDLRRAMNDVDHEIAVVRLQTLEDVITSATDQPAFRTLMVGGIAAIAILLTLVGMTGVLAYSVSQRTREIGVRVALGASSPAIRAMVVGEAARVGLAGIATGLAAAFVLARLLATELYGVSASDPLSFAAAALLVSLVTLGASYFPARHASNVDPLVALRSE